MDCKGDRRDGVYNCFGEYDTTICYDCKFNEKPHKGVTSNCFVSYKDKVDELYKFLKGEELPEGIVCDMPKLSAGLAFTVIWFLQEHLHILPDNIEQCDNCKELFDTNGEGQYLDGQFKNANTGKTLAKKYWGHWCDCCIPEVDFELK